MITKLQALVAREFHENGCCVVKGPRGGERTICRVWRRSGKTRTWKKHPEHFQVPVKYGLRESGYINDQNASAYHIAADCPLADASPVFVIGESALLDPEMAVYWRNAMREAGDPVTSKDGQPLSDEEMAIIRRAMGVMIASRR